MKKTTIMLNHNSNGASPTSSFDSTILSKTPPLEEDGEDEVNDPISIWTELLVELLPWRPRSLFSRRQKKSLSSHLLPNYLVTKQYNVPIFSDSFSKFLTVFLYTCLRCVSFSKKCERTCAAKIRYPCFFTEFWSLEETSDFQRLRRWQFQQLWENFPNLRETEKKVGERERERE